MPDVATKRPPTRRHLVVVIAAAWVLTVGCGERSTPAPGDEPAGSSPAQPVSPIPQLLLELAERAPDENPFFKNRRLVELRTQLTRLDDTATPLERWRLYDEAARLELQQGFVERSVELYLAACSELPALEPLIPARKVTKTYLDTAIAFQRLGIVHNCWVNHNPRSCIVPIKGVGIQVVREDSVEAIDYFLKALRRLPDKPSTERLKGIWLLNLTYMSIDQYPDGVPPEYLIDLEPFYPEEEFPEFVSISSRVGLDTWNLAGSVITEDFDGDGLLDIFSSTIDLLGQALYFHNNGDGTFSDWTERGGFIGYIGGLNAVHTDYDNDGNYDILVLRGSWFGLAGKHPNTLFHNDGDGTFTDVTMAAGLGFEHFPTQTVSWSDYDNDGDLDVYISNEYDTGTNFHSQLFRNNGDGTFTDVAPQAGVINDRYGKGVSWGDYDQDGWPDLFVSNQPFLNRLYHNDGDGTFTDVAPEVGMEHPKWSFPTWFWDYDNDGALDLFVGGYLPFVADVGAYYLGLQTFGDRAFLYKGDGKGGFEEVSRSVGLTQSAAAMSGAPGDIDNDGYPDFLLGTGYPDVDAMMPNAMFWNRGGERFVDVTLPGGFGHLQKGHGISFTDLDNDGDQDVFAQMGGFFPVDAFGDALFENPGFGNSWLKIDFTGTRSNRAAIGVRIRCDIIEDGEPRSVYAWVNSGGSFGARTLRREIGLGGAERIERLEVLWPTTGELQSWTDVAVNQLIAIREGEPDYRPLELKRFSFAGVDAARLQGHHVKKHRPFPTMMK